MPSARGETAGVRNRHGTASFLAWGKWGPGKGALGALTVTAICLVALVGSAMVTYSHGGVDNAVSMGFGTLAVASMSMSMFLAARPRFLEPYFDGLDRMYRVHKWLGITALAALLLHDQIELDFERLVPETDLGELGEELGKIAYYGFLVLVLSSWFKRVPFTSWEVPYRFWYFTHRLMGGFFALVVFHQMLVDTPFGWTHPLFLSLNALGILGIGSYLFVEFFGRRWRRRAYHVSALNRGPGATELLLRPKGRQMRWQPGQFAFLSAPAAGLRDARPFTIAGAPVDGTVRFMVKPLGDWSRRLPDRLRPGDPVHVEGPYGRFDICEGGNRQIWIAGGVGITPFLALAQTLSEDPNRRAHLFYCVRNADEAIGLDTLKNIAADLPNFSFDLVVTSRDGRLGADRVAAATPFDPDGSDFFICGAVHLRTAIVKGLKSIGIKPRKVHFELFEFR